MHFVDLNCDMGEGYGPWKMGRDAEILGLVSSANIACGFHAGDPRTIRETVEASIAGGVAVGAHPSFPDLQGFGRRKMDLTPEEVYDFVLYQISAVAGFCRAAGGSLHHVKPHGALYNQAAVGRGLASAIARAVKAFDKDLILYGLSGSYLIAEAEAAGLRTASEVFADRTYCNDGTLTPRSRDDALVSDPNDAAHRALRMVAEGTVESTEGKNVPLKAETICIHGDGKHALEFAEAINKALKVEGIEISAP